MYIRVSLVFELAREKPPMRFCKLGRLVHHPCAAFRSRRQHHLGAKEPHQPASLNAEGLGHRQNQRITLLGTHHRKPNAGITACGLDNCLPRLQLP